MINKININPIAFKNYNSVSNGISSPIDNKSREFNSDFYVDKSQADAIKSYNSVSKGIDINKPVSLSGYVSQLERAGLVKDRDFDVLGPENGASVYIHYGNDSRPVKIVRWSDGDSADNMIEYQNWFYPNNDDTKCITSRYNHNGQLLEKSISYKNPNEHKDLFPAGIDPDTTPEKYISYLEKNGIKYEVDNSDDSTYIKTGDVDTFFHTTDDYIAISQLSLDSKNNNIVHNFEYSKLKNKPDFNFVTISDFYSDNSII